MIPCEISMKHAAYKSTYLLKQLQETGMKDQHTVKPVFFACPLFHDFGDVAKLKGGE